MANEDFNGGKDLMEEDICIGSVPERKAFRATLAFLQIGTDMVVNKRASVKVYQALGDTEQKARNGIIDIMVEHLTRLKK